MTRQEVNRRCQIPVSVLKEYERWGLDGSAGASADPPQYGNEDLRRLSVVMTLYDLGFTRRETEAYMRLLLEQPASEVQRLRMMEKKRSETLEEIHLCEHRLARLDYLRCEIRKEMENSEGSV